MRLFVPFLLGLYLLGFYLPGSLSTVARADEPTAAANDFAPDESSQVDLEKLAGQIATVTLHTGVEYADTEVSKVSFSKKDNSPARLFVRLDTGRRRSLKFSSIKAIRVGDNLVYEGHAETESAKLTPEQQADAEHEQWLARLQARGVKPWGELSEAEHQEAIDAHKKRYEEVKALLPSMQLVETKHFLFCTNIPPQQVGVFVASLDRMYEYMQQTYGVDPEKQVWRGKASIFAFVRQEEFVAFERQFMENNPQEGTAGLCHSDSRRNIVIAVHQGTSADYFGVVLVHETSHGFIHCFQTPERVPSWVNEGMAEVIASLMVPTSKGVQRKEERFLEKIRNFPQPRLGEEFFATDQNIPFDRYGGATSMTRFLLKTDQRKYVKFIKLLKEGMPWEEALTQSYNATKEQLVSAYGAWVGVPALRP